jgi:L-threonylcarbamoyladenylate synthase
VEASLGVLTAHASKLARAFWPGPLTIVLDAPATLPAALLGGRRSIAVRVPAHAVARALARCVGVPLTATSANVSGHRPTSHSDEVWRELGALLDGLVDAGPSPGGPPSTIVEPTAGAIRLVRAGAVPFDRVVQFLSS